MTDVSKDLGVAVVLLDRLSKDTLPKAVNIKEKVDRGEKLDHWDIEFLEELLRHAEQVRPLVDRHPEYQDIFAQTVHLYKQITHRALLNETGADATE